MNYQHRHRLEKTQVQLAAVAAIVGVYVLAWPMLRPADPLRAAVFIPFGSYGSIVALGLLACLLGCLCSIVTVKSRPVGAMLALMLGLGAISLRSAQIRTLFWQRQGDMGSVFPQLMIESLFLLLVAAAGCFTAALTREMLCRVNGGLRWRNPLADLTDEQREDVRQGELDTTVRLGAIASFFSIISALGMTGSKYAGRREPTKVAIKRSLSCMVMGMAISVVVLLLLMRSADRGQVVFALAAAFCIGILTAHQKFPAQHSIVAWCCPMLTAAGLYCFAWARYGDVSSVDWSDLPFYMRALPIDWLGAGGSGALSGYWISERLHELRHIEKSEQQGEK